MVESRFIAQVAAQVNLRPRKLGYLIQAGRADQFRRAAAYALTEWGGAGQPIAPVLRKDHIYPGMWQMLETLRPEIFVDYVGVSSRLADEVNSRLGSTIVPETRLQYDEPGVHTLLSVTAGQLRDQVILEPRRAATIAEELAVGLITADPENDRLWAETGGMRRPAISAVDLVDAQLDSPSPLWTTKQNYHTWRTELVGSPLIVYTDERPTLNRLVNFWNVRALGAASGISVLWVPLNDLPTASIVDRLRDLCYGKTPSVPDLILLGPSLRRIDNAARRAGFVRHLGRGTISLPFGRREVRTDPLTYWRRIDPRGFVLGERQEGTRTPIPLTVASPTTQLHFQSPIAFNRSIGGKIRLEIDEVEALQWPRRPAVARLLEQNASWTAGGLSVVVFPSATYRLNIHIPEASEVLGACLGEVGWSWSISDKGKYASALLAAVPGRRAINILQSRLSMRIVRELASLTSRKAGQLLRSLLPAEVTAAQIQEAVTAVAPTLSPRWRTSAEIATELSKLGERVKRDDVVGTLNTLLGEQIARRAFRFKCATCNLVSNIPFDVARDHVECEGCSTRATLVGASGEPELTYGLNSLADRALDQDCLGHLPVQRWMETQLGAVWSVPGADLKPTTGTPREIDVLGVSRTAVLASEVKNSTDAFTDDAIRDTVGLARAIRADHLVLASLGDWSAARRQEVKVLAASPGMEVSVVGMADLQAVQT